MYLIPAPQKMETQEGFFPLQYDSYVCISKGCSLLVNRQVSIFLESLKDELGFGLLVSKGDSKAGDIVLVQDNQAPEQSYTLDTTGDKIVLTGDEKGLWHGLQTILQIARQCGATFPRVSITDFPTILNRGHYLDVTRGRIPKMEWLKQWINKLAYYKINQFQLYMEHTYLFREIPELWRDDTPFTAEEILELDEYCAVRGVELVPSLSTFGHLHKLLSSKQYQHLCELENSNEIPFSVLGRMRHHTFDASNPESIALILTMISEYMGLFRSKHFNICADETFDLGRGRSKAKAEEVGRDRMYIEFVKQICDFLVENGKVPMFWGDIIVGFPELIHELPKETICLTWGYDPMQREYETMKMAEVGANQYCCPGCCGWNELVNVNWNSYRNIEKMASYARKYKAAGLLNTDWGDFLHVNHLDFSIVGVIYGAAFSWTENVPSYELINQQISKLEFGDSSERLLEVIEKVRPNTTFSWHNFCDFADLKRGVSNDEKFQKENISNNLNRLDDVEQKCANLVAIKQELYQLIANLPRDRKAHVRNYIISVEGIRILNRIGQFVAQRYYDYGVNLPSVDTWKLASELDHWFYYYKEVYRSVSREADLHIMQELMNFYGDILRTK